MDRGLTGLKGDAYDAPISLELISEPEDSWSRESRDALNKSRWFAG